MVVFFPDLARPPALFLSGIPKSVTIHCWTTVNSLGKKATGLSAASRSSGKRYEGLLLIL